MYSSQKANPSGRSPGPNQSFSNLPPSPAAAGAAAAAAAAAAALRPLLLRDLQDCVPLTRVLGEPDIILLLTPVVSPAHPTVAPGSDPFEVFGQSLAKRHAYVRHVPYTKRGGITGTHVAFIRRARVVVFVVSGPIEEGEASQVEMAGLADFIGESRPQIVVACSHAQVQQLMMGSFPTVVQVGGYSPPELEAVAALLFGDGEAVAGVSHQQQPPPAVPQQQPWKVDSWHPHRDIYGIFQLWKETMPPKYQLSEAAFRNIASRDGYVKHFVVRDPRDGSIVGACLTYTTYADSGGDNLVASIASVMVRPSHQRLGIGTLLHDTAILQLRRTRGVHRLQLGSTFPRLFYGLPTGIPSTPWFRARGWAIDEETTTGRGQFVSDWLLIFEDMPQTSLSGLPGFEFRSCEMAEFQSVVEFVAREEKRGEHMGWYDQYTHLVGSMHIEDVVLGLQDGKVVATALTYVCGSGSPVADDLPWAATMGVPIGGATCICITENDPATAPKRNAIMMRLLTACVVLLQERGCTAMFLDGVKGGHEGFQFLGFEQWAQYRESWKDF